MNCPHCNKPIDRATVAKYLGQSGGQANAFKNLDKLRSMASMAAKKRWSKK